jgi:hypothetical protein
LQGVWCTQGKEKKAIVLVNKELSLSSSHTAAQANHTDRLSLRSVGSRQMANSKVSAKFHDHIWTHNYPVLLTELPKYVPIVTKLQHSSYLKTSSIFSVF